MAEELCIGKSPPRSSLPHYKQIEMYLRSHIADRTYPTGSKLPSELELAHHFRVSRITVRHALLRLQFDGLVQRHPGQGTIITAAVVVHKPTSVQTVEEVAQAQGLSTGYRMVSYSAVEGEPGVLAHLRSSNPEVFLLRRVKLIEGQPVALEMRFFPHHVGRRLASSDAGTLPLFALLDRATVRRPVRIAENYSSCVASKKQAPLLQVRARFPLLLVEHTIFDKSDVPVEYGKTVFRSDRYRMSLEFQQAE